MSFLVGGQAAVYKPGDPSPGRGRCLSRGRVFDLGGGGPTPEMLEAWAREPAGLYARESDLSFAWYFPAEDKVVLVRDACGLTPLFYAPLGDGWAVAFDLGELFRTLGRVPGPDEDTFFDFAATHYRHIFRDPSRTFHLGVRQVPAGHQVVLDAGSPRDGPRARRWLELPFQRDLAALPPDEASREYVALLDKNVACRLEALAGEKYAFTISSGMDSSTVAALAARKLKKPLSCWFMAYKDQAFSPYDESGGVEALIRATGWELNRVDLGAPDLLAETRDLMELTRAPLATVTWLAHHVLAREAKSAGCDHLFSGLGGDESLAGEFEHFFVFFADLRASGQTELLDRETEAWARLHDHPVFKKSPRARDEWLKKNVDFANLKIKVDQDRYRLNRDYFDPLWWEAMERRAPPVPMPHPYPSFLSNRLYQEMNYETSPPTVWSETLSSGAAGVRGVFPMASPRLLSLALSCPGTAKYQDGVTKMLLRRGLEGILPDCARLNPVKTGFNAPLDLWLREPRLFGDVRDLLTSPPFINLGWIRRPAVERIMREHLQGARNHMMLLWPLISTALFLQLDQSPPARAAAGAA
ncbi:MAG: hypothetical protein LBP95_11550 [Deltaproteobacteria bacterium]|nr:hypothetical protein [Deltaproteobacteria bacterium]